MHVCTLGQLLYLKTEYIADLRWDRYGVLGSRNRSMKAACSVLVITHPHAESMPLFCFLKAFYAPHYDKQESPEQSGHAKCRFFVVRLAALHSTDAASR